MRHSRITKRIIIFLCLNFIFITQAAAQVRYTVIPENPRPGEPITIGASGDVTQAVLLANGIQLLARASLSASANETQLARAPFIHIPPETRRRFFRERIVRPGFSVATLTVPSTAAPGLAIIRLKDYRDNLIEIPVEIAEREFFSETIHLTPALDRLLTAPDPQRVEEAHRLWAILNTTGETYYHTGKFVLPVVSTRRTSAFGSRRVNRFPDGRTTTSIHAGIDFGIPTGTEVFASGAGRVALARMRIVSGYSVIIEHGPGIYSLYYHLDKVIAQEGEMVRAGDLIGLSGSTGFSTGPHLHWELRINGENTDPDAFVARPILDKDLIISRLYGRN
jgi:murein DD-endopeptidase MepM/ murein hydrolase activator NlpD